MSIKAVNIPLACSVRNGLLFLIFISGMKTMSGQEYYSPEDKNAFSKNVFETAAEPVGGPGNPGDDYDAPPASVDKGLWVLYLVGLILVVHNARKKRYAS